MKELGEVTFMKEGMKALDDTRILALTHLKFVVSFPKYGHLKKKSASIKNSVIVNLGCC